MKKVPGQPKSENGGKSKMTLLKLLFFSLIPSPPRILPLPCLAHTRPLAPQPWLLLMKSPILSISHFLPPKPLSFDSLCCLLSFQALKKATRLKTFKGLWVKGLWKTYQLYKKVRKKLDNQQDSAIITGWMRHCVRMIQRRTKRKCRSPSVEEKTAGSQVTSEWDQGPQKYPWSLRNCQVCTHWILQQQGTLMVIQ